jgi:hypothetical protein
MGRTSAFQIAPQAAEGNRGGWRVREACDWDRVTERYLELCACRGPGTPGSPLAAEAFKKPCRLPMDQSPASNAMRQALGLDKVSICG